jgi:hypothetical protein
MLAKMNYADAASSVNAGPYALASPFGRVATDRVCLRLSWPANAV